jgi:hypothetical protein
MLPLASLNSIIVWKATFLEEGNKKKTCILLSEQGSMPYYQFN